MPLFGLSPLLTPMNYSGWLLLIHAASATAFVMIMIIMQLVVSNVMKRIPDSPGKKEAGQFLQKRFHPVVDLVIVIVGLSAGGLLYFFWPLVKVNIVLMIKITFGSTALTCAYLNHFVFRNMKRKLVASGQNPELLAKLKKITPVIEKVALVTGVITAFLGWYVTHV